MDFGAEWSVVSLMDTTPPDDDTHDLIRQLCTRAGMIMEDASAYAILWDGDLAALADLADALARAQTLIAAARSIAC